MAEDQTPQDPDRAQRQIASAINLIAADQGVLRVTLQCVLLNMVGGRPESAELLSKFKRQVIETLRRIPKNTNDPQAAARKLQLARSELLFQELERAISAAEMTAPSDNADSPSSRD